MLAKLPDPQSQFGLGENESFELLHNIVKQIVQAIEKNDLLVAAAMLRQLAIKSCEFPKARLLKIAHALENNTWALLADDFVNQHFIGQNGYVLIIGPFTRLREGQKIAKLTVIFGQVISIPVPINNLEALTQNTFGTLLQPIPPVLPIRSIATCGNIGQEEAFLSPDGWCFPGSERGWGLINLTAHQQRFNNWILTRIRLIFEPNTADLILQLLEDSEMQLQEYCLHEAGHAAGLGLHMKSQKNLLPDSQQSGWEEYKTDIVGFYLAAKALTPEQAGRLVAATLCIRLGIDAHRPGGPDQDHDALASLLILDRLLLSGQIQLLKNDQLALQDVSYEGLYRATTSHRIEAEYLVQQELDLIENPLKLLEIYNWRHPHPGTRKLFDRFVERCRPHHPITPSSQRSPV